ncbi:hypothetical protein LguiB_020444 [Lonicera macranthoides]
MFQNVAQNIAASENEIAELNTLYLDFIKFMQEAKKGEEEMEKRDPRKRRKGEMEEWREDSTALGHAVPVSFQVTELPFQVTELSMEKTRIFCLYDLVVAFPNRFQNPLEDTSSCDKLRLSKRASRMALIKATFGRDNSYCCYMFRCVPYLAVPSIFRLPSCLFKLPNCLRRKPTFKSESQRNGKQELLKAFDRLGKVLPEEDIHQLVGSMVQKNGADLYASDYSSFVAKRLQDEAEEQQNRREKEEAALRKQASLMEHFHKRSTNSSSTSHNVRFFNKSNIS